MKEELESLVRRMIEGGIKFEDAIGKFEKRFVKKALEAHKGNQTKAARLLGIHRNTLSRKILEHGLDHKPKRRRKR